MGLDAHVYCRCISDRIARQHPFPELLVFSSVEGAYLCGPATERHHEVHDKWFDNSCAHHGYAARERLGNIAGVALIKETLECAEDRTALRFPLFLRKVVYDGTHTGDHIELGDIPALIKEIEASRLIVFGDKNHKEIFEEFMTKMDRLSQACLNTNHPLVF